MTGIFSSGVFLRVLDVLITVVAAIISITLHEVSHGLAAYKCGVQANAAGRKFPSEYRQKD